MEQDYSEAYQPSCSQPYKPDYGAKKPKRYPKPERPHQTVSYGTPEGRTWGRESPVLSSDQECSDYGHPASPTLSDSPQELSPDLCIAEEREQKALQRKANKSRQEGGHGRVLGEPQDKGSLSWSKESKTSHKERRWPEAKGEERLPAFSPEPLHKGSSKEFLREASLAGGSKEKPKAVDSSRPEKKRESGGSKKEKPPLHTDFEESLGNHVKKQKHVDSEPPKAKKARQGSEVSHGSREKRKPEQDLPSKNKEKTAPGSLKTPEGKSRPSDLNKKRAGFSPSDFGDREAEDEFEKPIMSFENYLMYDQPQHKKKKKKKVAVKPPEPAPVKDRGQAKQNGSKSSTKSSDSGRKSHKQVSEKKQSEASRPTKVSQMQWTRVCPDLTWL